MTTNKTNNFNQQITLDVLHKYMQQDPFYDITSTATPAIVSNIYQNNKDNYAYEKFTLEFFSNTNNEGTQHHLIYL